MHSISMQYILRLKEFFLNQILFFSYLFTKQEVNGTCAGIVFSKDRPLQLEALLNSYDQYVEGKSPLYVLYTVSNGEYEKAYNEIIKLYSSMNFIKEKNFREDLVSLLKAIHTDKLFFLVDDILFIRKFDLRKLTDLNTKEFIPSLRMGRNITYSFMKKKKIVQPEIYTDRKNLIYWNWSINNSYWSYPISVDGHIFSKIEIEIAIKNIKFSAPNSLEWQLQSFNRYFSRKKGCSFENSVIVNLPWNKVQTENSNDMGEITTQELLNLWNQGKRLDIEHYLNQTYDSAHFLTEMRTK